MQIYSATPGTMELDSRYWIDTPGATLDNITRALGNFANASRCFANDEVLVDSDDDPDDDDIGSHTIAATLTGT